MGMGSWEAGKESPEARITVVKIQTAEAIANLRHIPSPSSCRSRALPAAPSLASRSAPANPQAAPSVTIIGGVFEVIGVHFDGAPRGRPRNAPERVGDGKVEGINRLYSRPPTFCPALSSRAMVCGPPTC
jgi:hypothetical protein